MSEHRGSETEASPGPGSPAPGERRLARPPSDRYRTVEPEPIEGDPNASPVRGAALGAAVAAIGAVGIVLLGGVLTVTSGLIVAAGAIGWVVGLGIRLGAGATLNRSSRVQLAVGLAVLAVVAGQLGLWVYARSEGGVLGPLDYLAEVFGLLVPLELIVACLVAWITSR